MDVKIQKKLDHLAETKQMIREVIEEKGQTVTDDDSFRSYVEKIANIEAGADVSGVTATAADVLEGKTIVDAEGNEVEGSIPKRTKTYTTITSVFDSLDHSLQSGYYADPVKVYVDSDRKTVTPTKESQTVTGSMVEELTDAGALFRSTKFLAEVTVNPIPEEYQDVSNVTATAEDVKAGKVFVDSEGNEVEGALTGTLADVSIVTAKSEDVLEGKVIVDSTGYAVTGTLSMASTGGGGSLPAGAYWMQKGYPPYMSAPEYFPFGNTEYYFAKPSSSSTTYNLYDYADGAYNLIYSGVTKDSVQCLEYNGKIHIIGYNAQHYVYNGRTATMLNRLPSETLGRGHINRFVWNGYLYVNAAGKLYKWDESTDTWTDTGLMNYGSSYTAGQCFVYNDTVYRYDSSKLYKYVDGVQTKIKEFDMYFKVANTYNEIIYLTYQNQLYSYNIETDTLKYIGVGTGQSYYYTTADGKLINYGTSYQHYQLYEVTE